MHLSVGSAPPHSVDWVDKIKIAKVHKMEREAVIENICSIIADLSWMRKSEFWVL